MRRFLAFPRALVAMTLLGVVTSQVQGGNPRPAAPHVHMPAPPRVPQYKFSAPRPPQMHFTQPHVNPAPHPQPHVSAPHRNPTSHSVRTEVAHANTARMPAPSHSTSPHVTAPKPSAGANNPTASKPATATHASIQPYILMIPPIGMGMGVPMIGAYPRMVHSRGYGYYGYRYRRNHYNRGYSGYNRSNALQAARLRHLQKLVADLDSLSPGASVPASAGNTLRTDLLALAQGGYHPSRDSALAVSTALISTLPQRKHNLLDTMRLASDLEAVVNAGNVSPEGINEAILDAETVLKDGGVARPGIQTVATALHTLGGLGLRAVR